MALGPILVILHIVFVSVWLGYSILLQFQAKALGVGGDPTFAEALRAGGNRTVQMMTISVILFYAVAVANFFVGGGFAVYTTPFHTALLLGLALVLVQVLMIQPAWGRLAAGQPAQRKRVSMALGIGHTLWLVMLVLMFFGPYWRARWGF